MNQIDITPIVSTAVALISLLITTFLIPYIKTKISAEKLAKLLTYAKIAVEAAEQIFRETGMGEKKKAYVAKYLADLGYKLNGEELDVIIESAVLEMKNELIE